MSDKIDLSGVDLSAFKKDPVESKIDLSGVDLSAFKKKGKEESVSAEPSQDLYTNTTGQTSTEADTLEQEPLIYRQEDYDPLGVTQIGEPKDYSQAPEIDFDEGIANAITTEGLDKELEVSDPYGAALGGGVSTATQLKDIQDDRKEDVAWNYFQERYRQVPPDQLLLLEGALERNAPEKYAQYALEKYRSSKVRADQQWSMPQSTPEEEIDYKLQSAKYEYPKQIMQMIKDNKTQQAFDMLVALDEEGKLKDIQSLNLKRIKDNLKFYPIDSDVTKDLLKEVARSDKFYSDAKKDDGAFSRGMESTFQSARDASIALESDPEEAIDYFEYLFQKDRRTEPVKDQGMISQGLEMLGGVVPTIGATIGASVLATPVGGAVVGGLTSAQQGYGQSLKEAYFKARTQGYSKEKAYELAESQAVVGSIGAGIEGIAGSLVGVRSPSTGFLGKATSFIKDVAMDAGVAGASKTLQNIHGESLGLDYTTFEGVPENMLAEAMFGAGVGAGQIGAKAFITRLNKLPTNEKLRVLADLDQRIAEEAKTNPNIIQVAYKQEQAPEGTVGVTPEGIIEQPTIETLQEVPLAETQPIDTEQDVDIEKQVVEEAPPVEQEVKPTVEEKVEPEEDIEFDLDELSALEKEVEASESEGNLLDNLGQRAFMNGEEGMIRTHPEEPNTIIFETNERRIDLAKIDEGDKLLSDFDISLMSPEGVDVRPKGESVDVTTTPKGRVETTTKDVDVIDFEGKKYRFDSERRPKKGDRVVRVIDVENNRPVRFRGEKAERILKDISLRKDDPTQSPDVKKRPISETPTQEGTPITQELKGTEQATRSRERIGEGDTPTSRRATVEKLKSEWEVKTNEDLAKLESKRDQDVKEFESMAKSEVKERKRGFTEDVIEAEYEVKGKAGKTTGQKGEFEVVKKGNSTEVFEISDGKRIPLNAEAPKNTVTFNIEGKGDFKVTLRSDGSMTVSQKNPYGKYVAVQGDQKAQLRNQAKERFPSERRKLQEDYALQQKKKAAARRAFKEAKEEYDVTTEIESEALVGEFKKEQDDKIITWFDNRINELDKAMKELTGSGVGLVAGAAKTALQIVKVGYEAGKSLSVAIKDAHAYLKKEGLYTGSETQFKKWVLGELKSGKSKTKGYEKTKQRPEGKGLKINSEKVQYNGKNAIGSRTRSESEQNVSRQKAKQKIKNPETNASLKAANEYNSSVGLPEVTPHEYKKSDPIQQTEIADIYEKLQDVNSPSYKESWVERRIYNQYKKKYPKIFKDYNITDYKDLVHKAYSQLIKEVDLQYEGLPVKITFHKNGEGNYENNLEMLDDVHNFNHLWVYKGGDDHTELGSKTRDQNGLTANDKFRAVHDYYGHSVEGYQFGKRGEENAWIEHSKMFSPLAQWALSSETRGQNSWVNYSGVNDVVLDKIKTGAALKKEGKIRGDQQMINEGQTLLDEVYDEFQFAEQKAVMLPPEYSDFSNFHSTKISDIPNQLKAEGGKSKTESDTDTTSKAEGTGRTGTTKTKDTDGGQDKGKQPRAKGKDKKGDVVLPKEESTVQEPSAETGKRLGKKDIVRVYEDISNKVKSLRSAFRKGQTSGKDIKQDLEQTVLDFIRDNKINLDKDGYKKLSTSLKKIRTEDAAIKAIEKAIEDSKTAEFKSKKKQVQKLFKDFKSTKLLPEFELKKSNILDIIDEKGMSLSKRVELSDSQEYFANNPDKDIPVRLIEPFKRLSKVGLDDMDINQLSILEADINRVLTENKRKQKLKQERKESDLINNKIQELVDQSKDRPLRQVATTSKDARDFISKTRSFIRRFPLATLNARMVAKIMDRGEGAITKNIYNRIQEATDKAKQVKSDARKEMRKDLEGLNLKDLSEAFSKNPSKTDYDFYTSRPLFAERDGKIVSNNPSITKRSLTGGEEVMIYLHSLNESNRTSMMEGGFAFRGDEYSKFYLSADQLNQIITKVENTPELKKSAEAILRVTNEHLTPKLAEVYRNLNGVDLDLEENYVRKVTNPADINQDPKKFFKDFDEGELSSITPLQNRGFLKSRVANKNGLILEDAYASTLDNIKSVSEYIGKAEPLQEVREFLSNKMTQQVIRSKYGQSYLEYLTKYVDDVDKGSRKKETSNALVNDLMNRFTYTALSINPFVVAKQFPSLFLTLGDIDPKYMVKATANTFAGKGMSTSDIADLSPMMEERFEGFMDREMGAIASLDEASLFFQGKKSDKGAVQKAIDAGMGGIQFVDTKTIRTIWDAVRLQLLDTKYKDGIKGREAEFNADLKKQAETIIKETQPTYGAEDRSEIARSESAVLKGLTMFSTQRNKIANMLVDTYVSTDGFKKLDKKSMRKLTGIVMSAISIAITDYLRQLSKGKEESSNEENSALGEIGLSTVNNIIGSFYLTDPVVDFTKTLADPKQRTFEAEHPAFKLMNLMKKTGSGLGTVISGETGKQKSKAAGDLYDATLEFISYGTKVPVSSMSRYLRDYAGINIKNEIKDIVDADKEIKRRPSKYKSKYN